MIYRFLLLFLVTTASLSAAQRPKAIVFDFGGVMTDNSHREIVVSFLCETFQLSASDFEEINQKKKRAIESGMTDVEFWLKYAREQEISLPDDWVDQFKGAMKKAISINGHMYAMVDALKKQEFVVGLLSNVDQRLGNLIRDFGFYEPFDPCILSYEIGFAKPHPGAYQALLQALDLPPEKIVFVDDKIENVTAAKELGIDAILFQSTTQLMEEFIARHIFARLRRSACEYVE